VALVCPTPGVKAHTLLPTRATTRRREIAIRAAMGASRRRIIRQLLTESMMLALAGGAIGLLLALWGVDILLTLSPRDIPRLDEIGVNGQALAYTFVCSLLTGLIFGLAPSIHASRTDLASSLKDGGAILTGGIGRNRLRSLLVISEIALTLVLLAGAGLMIRSFVRLLNVDMGFKPER